MNEQHAGAADAAQVAAVRQSLGCSNIGRDEQALRRKYADSPSVLAALDATWVKVIQRVPVTVAPEARQPSASEPSAK